MLQEKDQERHGQIDQLEKVQFILCSFLPTECPSMKTSSPLRTVLTTIRTVTKRNSKNFPGKKQKEEPSSINSTLKLNNFLTSSIKMKRKINWLKRRISRGCLSWFIKMQLWRKLWRKRRKNLKLLNWMQGKLLKFWKNWPEINLSITSLAWNIKTINLISSIIWDKLCRKQRKNFQNWISSTRNFKNPNNRNLFSLPCRNKTSAREKKPSHWRGTATTLK